MDEQDRKSFNENAKIKRDQDEDFSIWDATILLTSRAIGTGFLFFPSH